MDKTTKLQNLNDRIFKLSEILKRKQENNEPITVQALLLEDLAKEMRKLVGFANIKLEVITPADVEQAEPKRNSRTKQTEIDGLLDELNVLKTVIDICGSDEDYAVRIADVKRKLKEATA